MSTTKGNPFVMAIPKDSMWQTTALDEAVAEELFGWEWLAFEGVPVRGTPGYPNKCRVRQFVPPKKERHKSWNECAKADGSEPLSYRYCSSYGPDCVPHFSGHEDAVLAMEKEIHRRKLWDDYQGFLAAQIGSDKSHKLRFATCEQKCIAALAAVGSKYVTAEPTP